ncbi:PAS domain-containing protein [Flavobacterium sp. Sd200]|uniref:PAS domain S-box protein n=1 Tax=Flavobacterium sp. Sd200 TaxID=2692211 RepID=UPI00136FC1CF|nr:PAS domain S-box protein [Flavobacterium sp. Sd200]MXN90458.1 PAS domain-containing protein [Flavobacterium sp. Sd200]
MHDNVPDVHHLIKALEASGTGTWCFDVASGNITADAIAQQLFCIPSSKAKYTQLLAQAHLDDRDTVGNAILTALSFGVLNITYNNAAGRIQVKGKRFIDESAGVETFHGTVRATSVKTKSLAKAAKNEDTLNTIIHQAPVAISLYVGRDMIIGLANDVMLSFWGKSRSIIGSKLEDAVPELEGQPFLQILDDVYTTGKTYQVTETPAMLALNGVLDTYYFDFTYKPLFDERGKVYAIMNVAVDVTQKVHSKGLLQESESLFRAITEQSPMAIGLLKGKDLVVEVGNDKIFEVWGKDASIIGKPLIEALPEIEDQGFIDILKNVYESGISYKGYDVLAKLSHNGVLKNLYFDFIYTPLKDENDNASGILIMANDVTKRVQTIEKIAESEARFKAVIYSAQAAMAVFKGRDLVTDIANDSFLAFVGRTEEEFVNRPLLESMPELHGQASIGFMLEVFNTGKKLHHYGREVQIMRNGILTKNYYNVSYTPLFDANGVVYGVLDIAIDVTESIKARQAIEEAEASLRGAIELAELGTWSLDPEAGIVTYSERMLQWFGFDGDPEDITDVYAIIHPKDRQKVEQAVTRALSPGSDGLYNEEYTIINRVTGTKRILHAQGKAFFNADGKAYMISGTAQDITNQRELQLALENEVKERTEALRKANEDLAEINNRLVSTNEELEQYAYVASHDLQEPLRKISMFSNLLRERDTLGVHKTNIDKIVKASDRMSLLIRDLLEFSRLLNTDVRFVSVNITNIVKAVCSDFELLIEEKNAEIEIEELPVIDAVSLQMNQLFYNLIANALKFVVADKTPKITVTAKKLEVNEVKKHIPNPLRSIDYYRFSVSDNGIGIDEQYQKQIFEVFKRLHSRTEYSGSGIGLALCRRIALNHHGAIYTESVIGEGATFHVILPQRQV